MGSFTNFLELEVLDHILKTGAYTPPATVYLALFTGDPGETGSVAAEATYTGYERVAITFGAAAGRSITQSGQVNFPAASGGSSIVTHWGLMLAGTKTVSDMMAYGTFTDSKTVTAGYQPFVATTEVVVTMSAGGISTAFATVLLDWLFRAQALAFPTTIQVALFSAVCSDAAAGTELVVGTSPGYARTTCNVWDVANAGASQNTGAITFPVATDDWLAAVHAAIYIDAVYALWLDVNDLTVLSGEYGRFIAGALDITLG
jgi:hypothetical protein